MVQELIYRDGLRIALSGRDDVLLEPVLRLLLKHITDVRFGNLACDVAGLVIGPCNLLPLWHSPLTKLITDMYSHMLGQLPLIDSLFMRLHKKVVAELKFQKELLRTRGALDMIFASAALSTT